MTTLNHMTHRHRHDNKRTTKLRLYLNNLADKILRQIEGLRGIQGLAIIDLKCYRAATK